MPFKKKDKNINREGRKIGAVNRTTKEAKEMLEQILFGQIDNIYESLENLKKESDSRYLDACAKLFTYVLPKKTDITSKDESIIPKMPTVIIKTRKNGNNN